ncbi:MAG: ribokinase [Planctomycetes bacterium]|nr:ribokinase [Planctomycetota bacterium]
MPPQIVVVGSMNMDLVAHMTRLPRPGETLHGSDFQTIPGGKGANQAVAAARLGARVTLIGRVGNDSFGNTLRQTLSESGVEVKHVLISPDCSSGVALISVDATGANSIVVVAGANGQLSPADIHERADVIRAADALMIQLETPVETIAAAIEIARGSGVRTILDPAPAPSTGLPPELMSVDLISPNQTEAEALTGIAVKDLPSAELAARQLQQNGAAEVVLKLGELGSLVCDAAGRVQHVPARSATIVDTTAAGDAFTAGLAVALSEGQPLAEAARFGGAAGTLACTVFGAQPAMPTRAAVEQFLQ